MNLILSQYNTLFHHIKFSGQLHKTTGSYLRNLTCKHVWFLLLRGEDECFISMKAKYQLLYLSQYSINQSMLYGTFQQQLAPIHQSGLVFNMHCTNHQLPMHKSQLKPHVHLTIAWPNRLSFSYLEYFGYNPH